ncbi:hypothetical protein [Streptomyces sp. NPDC046261]|uniref:hypothetical protein n=1 Tax=Streptomyces sp. NPDC046261 TaxID=3157200 RepID=UPI0033E7FCEA
MRMTTMATMKATWPAWAGRAAVVWSAGYAGGAVVAALCPGYAFGYAAGGTWRGTAAEWTLAAAYALAALLAHVMPRRPGARWPPPAAWGVALLALMSGFGFLFSPAHVLDLLSRNQPPMDWAAWANSGVATLGAVLWACAALAHRRHRLAVCGHCGGHGHRTAVERRTRAGYLAVAGLVPYATLKTAWALGAHVGYNGHKQRPGMDEQYAGDALIRLYDHGVDITAVLALIGMLLALALTLPWGRRLPRWPLLGLGWTGAGALAPFGVYLLVHGTLVWAGVVDNGMEAIDGWVVVVAYGGFSVYGLALGLATRAYQQATRRACAHCPGGATPTTALSSTAS